LFLEDGSGWSGVTLPLELVRGQVVGAAVRPHGVVVLAPGFDDDGSLFAGLGPFERQVFTSKLAIEAFVGAVLPGLTRSTTP